MKRLSERSVGDSPSERDHVEATNDAESGRVERETSMTSTMTSTTPSTAEELINSTQATTDLSLTIELTPELHTMLNNLSMRMSERKEDILRKGIILIGLAVSANLEGKKLGIATKDQPLVAEIFGF
jgi:hypothetical protein